MLGFLQDATYWGGLLLDVTLVNSSASGSGFFDLSFRLCDELAAVLGMITIRVKIKSDPVQIQKHIQNKVPKHITSGILRGEKHHPIVEQCVVFLNGGAGEVSLAGVVAPLFEQLRVIAALRGVVVSEEELQSVCDTHHSEIWKAYEIGVEKILDRDYGRAIALIELCEFDWQAGKSAATEMTGSAPFPNAVARAIFWNQRNGTHHEPGTSNLTQDDVTKPTQSVETIGKKPKKEKPAKVKQAKDTPERVKRREYNRRMS